MACYLDDKDIDDILNGSGNENSEDEDEDDIPFPGQGQGMNGPQSESSSSSDEDVPLNESRWKKKKFQSKAMPTASEPELRAVLTPAQYFEHYFTPELMEKFALATNQYYMKEKGHPMKPVCTSGEIKKFFGIHGLMGCFSFPRVKLFWNQRYKFDPIASAMARDRFFLLRVNLHVLNVHALNKEVEQSKNRLWKVQPVIDAVRNRCLQLPRDSNHYSIDEQKVPFGGRCAGLKVVVKNKPRPERLKNFVVTTSEGRVLDFEIYQGSTTNLPDLEKFGMGPAVILRLASSLPERSFLYFDRYFSSLPLMQELHKRNMDGTGTLMMNRFNTKKNTKFAFKQDTAMKRGEYEEIVSVDENICILKWKDNKGVLLTSTAFGGEPVTDVARWDKKSRQYVDVSCPAIVKNYNAFMGGVDTCDQLMEKYQTWLKTEKSTLKVTLHMFDLSIVNSWMEYRRDCMANNIKSKDTLDLLAFRISISEFLLTSAPRSAGDNQEQVFTEMPSTSKYRWKPLPAVDKQLDRCNHWPVMDSLKAPRACRALKCTSRTRCRCSKCDIYLCLTKDRNCFYDFHNQSL